MAFQLEEVTQVKVIHANSRTELHGKEHVRAVDLRLSLEGGNELLELIEPGLRDFHYFNRLANSGQMDLPPEAVGLAPKQDLRFPHLPTKYKYADGKKWRHYRWIRDFGTQDAAFDYTDCAAGAIEYEVKEGGTVVITFTVSYNGDELADNAVYGELTGLATVGDIHIRLLAPPELVPAKKGYRAHRGDTPQQQGGGDGQQELGEGEEDGETGEDGAEIDPDSPEGRLAASVQE